MIAKRWLVCMGLSALGCSAAKKIPPADDSAWLTDAGTNPVQVEAGTGPMSPETCTAGVYRSVSLTTDDGVSLQADFHASGVRGGPAVLLLHMNPPDFDRKSFPSAFIQKLVDGRLSVLNLDRRGGGGSKGVAAEAYTGPKGKLDVKAAMDFLNAHPCSPNPAKVAIVGASNGSTSALDYLAYATSAGRPTPAAFVFLTGGDYTEAQTTMASVKSATQSLPWFFLYAQSERDWSVKQQAGAPRPWRFQEYYPGEHGTELFRTNPEAMAEAASFVVSALP